MFPSREVFSLTRYILGVLQRKEENSRPGDQIVKVNDVDFRNLTHKEALNALRSAQDKVLIFSSRS